MFRLCEERSDEAISRPKLSIAGLHEKIIPIWLDRQRLKRIRFFKRHVLFSIKAIYSLCLSRRGRREELLQR